MMTEINGIPPGGVERLVIQPALALSKEVAQNQRETVEQIRKETLEARKEEQQKAAAAEQAAEKADHQEQQNQTAGDQQGTGTNADSGSSGTPKGHVSIVA